MDWTIQGSIRGKGKKLFSPKHAHGLWGPHSLLFNRYRGSFPEVKRAGREADHSPPSIAGVKNEWSYISTSLIRLHGVER